MKLSRSAASVALLLLWSCGGGGGPKSYTVSVVAGIGGSVSPATVTVTEGSTAVIGISVNEGYEIASVSGCGGSLSGTSYSTGPIAGACTVNARFQLKKYTVAVASVTGGTVSPGSATVDHGSTVAFTLTPAVGFSLTAASGCGGALSGTKYTTGVITGACTVEPTFSPNVELTLNISHSLASVGDSVALSWSSKHATACKASGDWSGDKATEGSFSVPTADAGRYQFGLECTGKGASAQRNASLVVPYPVLPTSYENKNSIKFDLTQVPSIRSLGLTLDSDEQNNNERAVTFGDFFQEGRMAAFVAVNRTRNVYGVKDINDSPSKSYFLVQNDKGVWVDRTSELLPSAAARDTCVNVSSPITADFNNDKKPDIFVSCEGLSHQLQTGENSGTHPRYSEIYLSNQFLYMSTAGKTYQRIELPLRLRASHASAADINRDGKVDIALTNISNVPNEYGQVVLLGNGDGTFQRSDSIIPREAVGGRRLDNDLGWFHYAHLLPIDGRLDIMLMANSGAVWIQGTPGGFDVWSAKRVEWPTSARAGNRYWMSDVIRTGQDFRFVGGAGWSDGYEMVILKTDFSSRTLPIYPVVLSLRDAWQPVSNQMKLASDGSLVGYTAGCQTSATGVCAARIKSDGLQTLSDLDVLKYVASHADLIESIGTDIGRGRMHYEQTGSREGRAITFDPYLYVASHPDLMGQLGINEVQATRHYIEIGYKEKRASGGFDALRYIASHGDLIANFGFDTSSATKNYILYGYQEGRKVTFDGLAYIASYGDLINSLKSDALAGIQHYIQFGFAEGRRVTFDALTYIASYADLIGKFGADVAAGAKHYIEVGFQEGRKATFNALAYLANHADLRSSFGANLVAATEHYIKLGFSEKRKTDPPSDSPLTHFDAHRFLIQTTFGPREAEIQKLLEFGYSPNGYERWIDAEIAKTPSLILPPLVSLVPSDRMMGPGIMQADRVNVWLQNVMTGDDQLRQRVAWALSQIFVVSSSGALEQFPFAMADFYDTLSRNAFGNYRNLLEDVTLHPAMGLYLSMLGNQRAVEGTNLRPDENYAREMMQLFSIGLVELELDGSIRRDASGQPIPTYNQEIIGGFARVFTGWGWGCPGYVLNSGRVCNQGDWRGFDPWPVANFNQSKRMELYSVFHEPGTKRVLSYPGVALPGATIPANQGGQRDLKDALDNVFNHPNVGPFISKQLIQKLVTSNPSPGYIRRVAEKFNNDGNGVRGNLGAVIKAILLDREARELSSSQTAGKVKEPLLRVTQLWRAYDAKAPNGKITTASFCCPPGAGGFNPPASTVGQGPGQSPSVFNFFSPFYAPPGEIAQAGLVAPELQLANENLHTSMGWLFHTQTHYRTNRQFGMQGENNFYINIDEEMTVSDDIDAVLDLVSLKLLGSRDAMSPALREQTRVQMQRWKIDPLFQGDNRTSNHNNTRQNRVSEALYLTVMSPDFAVQR
jgi:uncharacterized protein (DUF1800 family)